MFFIPERLHWDFPSGPVVKTVLPLQGAWLQSLVQELRFHMLQCSQKKKKQKEISERRSQFDNLKKLIRKKKKKKLIRRPPEARLKDVGSAHTLILSSPTLEPSL